MKPEHFGKGIFLLLLTALSWGGMFPVAKAALVTLDGFYLTAVRYGVTALVFLAILAWMEGPAALNPGGHGWRAWFFGSLGFAGFSLLVFEGLARSRPEHAAIIMSLQTPMTAFVNWWLRGHRPAKFTLGCIAVALSGVLLVITKGRLTGVLEEGTGLGDFLMFLGAVCWMTYTLGATGFHGWSSLRFTALTCALGTLSIFACTWIATLVGHVQAPTLARVASVGWEMAYLIAFASVYAVLAWNAGVQMVGALNGMLMGNLVPIITFAIGMAQGHRFEAVELIGVSLVVGALVANNLHARAVFKRLKAAR